MNKKSVMKNPKVRLKTRPMEEIEYMYNQVMGRIQEIDNSLSYKFGAQKELKESLINERRNIAKFAAFLQYTQFGKTLMGFSLDDFKSCTIITRHFGEDGWPLSRIYKRCKERLEKVQEEVTNYTNSQEYVELNKLHTALAWFYDDLKDCFIGLTFSWNLVPKKLKDEFGKGNLKDAFNTPDRKPAEEQALKELTQLRKQEIEMNLKSRFSFLKDRRRPTQKEVTKANKERKRSAKRKKGKL